MSNLDVQTYCERCGINLRIENEFGGHWEYGIAVENGKPFCINCSTIKGDVLFGIEPTSKDDLIPGFTKGHHWNGWATPYFTKQNADKVVDLVSTIELKAWYDEEFDRYIFQMDINAKPFNPDPKIEVQDGWEQYFGEDVEFKGEKIHVYAIGNGAWIWESFTPEQVEIRFNRKADEE